MFIVWSPPEPDAHTVYTGGLRLTSEQLKDAEKQSEEERMVMREREREKVNKEKKHLRL